MADEFHGADADGDLAAVFGEDPEHGLGAVFEWGAGGEGGPEAFAIEVFGFGDAGGVAEGGEPVGEVAGGVVGGVGGDFAGEFGDGGDAEAAFVDAAFVASEAGSAVEEGGVGAADVEVGGGRAGVGGAVVAGEDDEGAVGEALLLEFGDDAADVAVEIADHGGVTGVGSGVGDVAGLAPVGFGVPVGGEFVDGGFGGMHGDVGFDEGEVEEEGGRFLGFDEGFGFVDHEGGGVGLADPVFEFDIAGDGFGMTGDGILVEDDFLVVAPEVGGVVAVGDGLAVVAEEEVEAFAVGVAGAADGAEAPFADGGGLVAGLFEGHGEGEGFFGEGVLAFGVAGGVDLFHGAVAADFGVTEVFAGHEDAAGGGADGGAGVVMGEAGAGGGEGVEMGGGDFFLAEGADFAPAEVIGEDEDDVGFFLGGQALGKQGGGEEEGEESGHGGAEGRVGAVVTVWEGWTFRGECGL